MIPNIWGQSEGYTYIQLRDFKSGARNAPEDAAMRGFVATMSDADMLEIAKYASTQPWPEVEPISIDTALLKKGAYATAVVGCGDCHFVTSTTGKVLAPTRALAIRAPPISRPRSASSAAARAPIHRACPI